jgi:hypothetical protein
MAASSKECPVADPMAITDITRVAVEVVRTHSFPVRVRGSMPVSGGSNYVEILVRLDGLQDNRRMLLGVFRDTSIESLRQQITKHIRRLLADGRSAT